MKKLIKFLFLFILIIVLALGLFLSWITIIEYSPDAKEPIAEKSMLKHQPLQPDTFDIINWNIGYGGLGSEMDFFYDEGTNVRSTREKVREHVDNIKQFIKNNNSVDFWLIQEVDINSKRSWEINEVEEISEILNKNYYTVFAKNYDVPFVPVPFTNPMGHAKSGLLSASRHPFIEATRFALPLIASWPQRLFLLHRCYALLRFPLETGNELVVINTHNTAYVYDSDLRMKELNIIKQKMLDEYKAGNYVVVGGDWNQNPPGFAPEGDFNGHHFVDAPLKLDDNVFPKDWTVAFDNKAPSNRNNNKPFVKGENGTTVIDFFVLSPNIELLKIENIDLEFRDSDHNPVYTKIRLKKVEP